MAELLDLVALGTVADVVPLDQNNRILVHQGLNRIRAGATRPGILALLEISGRELSKLSASDLGFTVSPSQLPPVQKKELDQLNRERKTIESEMRDQAIEQLNKLNLSKNLPIGLCIFDETWHQGVIGILASRVKEIHHRPVIAFAVANSDEIKGSARSVNGVHIRDVLDAIASKHPGLVKKFGGHAMAAGLTLARAQFQEFADAFDREVRQHLNESDLRGQILSDGALTPTELNLRTAELLRDAGPWGQGFPEPIFDGIFTVVQQRLLKEKHLKLTLCLDELNTLDAIAFNVNNKEWPNHRCDKVRLAYRLDVNEWQQRRNLQLMIEHIEAVAL
jgi:single-stranded-DNA-specific exonuclease